MVKIKKTEPKIYCQCEECGNMFEIYRKRSRFCNVNCRVQNKRNAIKNP